MSMGETELLVLLRELDDPERLEWPLHYDRAAVSLAFGGLVRRLETDFGVQCEFEQDTQDSSEYGRVRVPAEATVCGTRIVVCVSKFGSLAEVCADNPGPTSARTTPERKARWTLPTSRPWSGRWPNLAT
ncbi:hypothetical protein ACFQ6U_33235 [Streptomyces sp. NPDC056465]|uniref:hypothetical protein n=1 Tax=Streptomyces sp. NPDC056465 TaxID=3345829 RepID=UPI0036C84EA7